MNKRVRPFKNLRIQPFFGDYQITVAWDAPRDCENGFYYVYRSHTGLADSWAMLNENAPVTGGCCHFIDENMTLPGAGMTIYYRLCYETPEGEYYDSEVVDLWQVLPRPEYGYVRSAIFEEYTQMRMGRGIPVFHCMPLTSGTLSPNIDPQTRLRVSTAPDGSYGMPYLGGFHTPVATYAVVSSADIDKQDKDDGTGFTERYDTTLRLLPFPRPALGHMLVNPRTDERWAVTGGLKPYLFRGIVPLAYVTKAVRIPIGDPRYGFPVPDMPK